MRSEAEKASAKKPAPHRIQDQAKPHSAAWFENKDARPCHSYVILTDKDTKTCTELGMTPVLDRQGCLDVANIATEHETDFANLGGSRKFRKDGLPFEDNSKPAGCYHLAPNTKDCSHLEGCFKFNSNPGFSERKAERKQRKGTDEKAQDILKELSEMNITGFVCQLPSSARAEKGAKDCPTLNGLKMYQTISDEDACSEYSGCMPLEIGTPFDIGENFNPEGNSVKYNRKTHPTGCLVRPHLTVQNGDNTKTPKVFWNNPDVKDADGSLIAGSATAMDSEAQKVCEVIKVVQFHRDHPDSERHSSGIHAGR
jgi:hypothetical protein